MTASLWLRCPILIMRSDCRWPSETSGLPQLHVNSDPLTGIVSIKGKLVLYITIAGPTLSTWPSSQWGVNKETAERKETRRRSVPPKMKERHDGEGRTILVASKRKKGPTREQGPLLTVSFVGIVGGVHQKTVRSSFGTCFRRVSTLLVAS
jgi:hypothetical protein